MIRRPPRSTQSRSSAASDVYKRQNLNGPVPTSAPLPPCASVIFDASVTELSPPPAFKAAGLRIEYPAKVRTDRKLDCGCRSVNTTVCGSGAETEACLLYTSDAADDLLCVD